MSKLEDIEKLVYVYAHKKTNIIAEHIIKHLKIKNSDYLNEFFIFCGKDAIPGYNAMHLAYLVDADGITTAGAGTSGEFAYLYKAYLYKEGGVKSNLLILPIENHNEQVANADALQRKLTDYLLCLNSGKKLEDGKKLMS